jgi:hypothetical protein
MKTENAQLCYNTVRTSGIHFVMRVDVIILVNLLNPISNFFIYSFCSNELRPAIFSVFHSFFSFCIQLEGRSVYNFPSLFSVVSELSQGWLVHTILCSPVLLDSHQSVGTLGRIILSLKHTTLPAYLGSVADMATTMLLEV